MTVPADTAGAELAVHRPHLPAEDLTDLLDGTVAPLSAVYGLDDQRFRAFAVEVGRLTRVAEAGRLIVGAYLHKVRPDFARGEWTPFVAELADAMQVKTDTLGKWTLAAERHFGLEVTKGANPTRRRALLGRPKPVLARDPSTTAPLTEPAEPDRTVQPHPPAGRDVDPWAPGGGFPPGTPGNRAVSPPDATMQAADHLDGVLTDRRTGCDIGAKSVQPDVTPPVDAYPKADLDASGLPAHPLAHWPAGAGESNPAPVGNRPTGRPRTPSGDATARVAAAVSGDLLRRALDTVLDAPPVELAILARDERTKVTAAHRALGRALADAKMGPGADEDEYRPCPHPKARLQVKPWGTICTDCGTKVR